MHLARVVSEAVAQHGFLAQAGAALARSGRVHIPEFLNETAARALYQALQATEWRLALNGDVGSYDLTAANVAALDPGQRQRFIGAIHGKAQTGFQFMFDSCRVSDLCESGALAEGALADLYSTLNSEAFLALMRELTRDPRIAYLDAQATRYRPGHFLTVHDDDVSGKNRLFAYVINLTPKWQVDWGGLLMFVDEDGHVAEAYTPRWNALNILRVPQPHAVSIVAPFATGARYSITGWMRSQRPEGSTAGSH
jgi:SM-20-related protein